MKNKQIGKTLVLFLASLFLFSGCNMPGKSSPTSSPTGISQGGAPTPLPTPIPGQPFLQITDPANGAQLPAGVPLVITFNAGGGPFYEIDLFVDSNLVDQLFPPGKDATLGGTLQWKAPLEGKHHLTVLAFDFNKTQAAADLDILMVGTGVVAPPEPPPQTGIQVNFIGLAGGSPLPASLDAYQMPNSQVTVEVTGALAKDVILDAGGLQVARQHNDNMVTPFQAVLNWNPPQGNGRYNLVIHARTADDMENYFTEIASNQITVEVSGLPADAPSIHQRFLDFYRQQFGLNPQVVPYAYYIRPVPEAIDPSRWVSAVYLNGMLYELNMDENGLITWTTTQYNTGLAGASPQAWICKPGGYFRILLLLVDYGNIGITQQQALDAVPAIQEMVNQWHRQYAIDHGLSAPLVQIELTGVYINPPPSPGQVLTRDQIQALTGYNTTQFDIVAEGDLDANASVASVSAGLGWSSGGCTVGGATNVSIFMTARSLADFNNKGFGLSLFDHELSHTFGWMHWWPEGDGSAMTQALWNGDKSCMAPLFFGWTDLDGDGVIEIQDPTPYGMTP